MSQWKNFARDPQFRCVFPSIEDTNNQKFFASIFEKEVLASLRYPSLTRSVHAAALAWCGGGHAASRARASMPKICRRAEVRRIGLAAISVDDG
jgi:hypothetical protein